MTDMPETVWLAPQRYGEPGQQTGTWSNGQMHDTTEYVRGDIHQALQAEKEALGRENQLQAREIDATRRRADKWQSMLMDCQEYLKPGETPKKRMDRDQNDVLGLMKLLEKEKRKSEALKAKLEAWDRAVQSLHSGDGLDRCALAVERFISPLNVPDRPNHAIQVGIRWVLDELRKRAAIDEN